MASTAKQYLPTVPADPAERLAVAAQAYGDLKRAETEVARIDVILAQGELAARRHNLSRADQFKAWSRQVDAARLLAACLGVQS